MNLREALRVHGLARRAADIVPASTAFTGAGGKTTAMFQLARSLESPVVVTTSTHLGVWQTEFADRHIIVTRAEDIEDSAGQIEGVTLVTGPEADNRLRGLDGSLLDVLARMAKQLNFPVLVEADGARQRALKVPAAHEPVIPPWVEQVVVVAGLSALGKPLDESTVHRPDLYALLSDILPGDEITLSSLLHVLTNPQGSLKGIPDGTRRVALLNQAGGSDLISDGLRLAKDLVGVYDAAMVASLADHQIHHVEEPSAGIVLAGGGSTRLGQPKMLLPWRGKPLIRYPVEAALDAGLAEVIVVAGSVIEPLASALEGLPVRIVENTSWQAGQSTSLQTGLRALSENTTSALFLLADQPLVGADLITELVRLHGQTLSPVVAPRAGGRRANPVLFDRVTFGDLLALQGDTGGRTVIDRYPTVFLDWEDETILFDVDTNEDYNRLLSGDFS